MAKNTEHYFDWAATTPPDSDILHEALCEAEQHWGNPSSIHNLGAEAKACLTKSRQAVAKKLGVSEKTIYFTSGGTESDHIPLLSILNRPEKGTVLISAIEHPAIREMAEEMKHCGISVKHIMPDENGIITPDAVVESLTDDTQFVTVMAVNNETGAIQPIYDIADALTEACKRKRRPKFHVDCVQALGKIPLDISHKGIDSAAFSAHKICGPRGTGVLYLANPQEPFLKGGGQESNIRSGTENLFGAVAFSKCVERYHIANGTDSYRRFEEQSAYTNDFINKLMSLSCCTLIPHSRTNETMRDKFSPWVLQAAFAGIPGQVMVRALSSKGFFISTGSACSAKKQSRPILEAMGINQDERENAVRFSFGPHTTKKAMDELFNEISTICGMFSKKC